MFEWPSEALPAVDINWRTTGTSISGPSSISLRTRFVDTSGGGYWLCDLSLPLSRKRRIGDHVIDQIKLVRALLARMRGGSVPVVLRTCECGFAPYPNGVRGALVPHSDGTPFGDGTEYLGGSINVVTAADAALRSPSLNINAITAAALTGGEAFSIIYPTVGEHRHIVCGIEGNVITIDPLVREDIPAGTPLNFNNPGCQVHCLNIDQAMSAINMGRFSSLSLQFEEDFG